MTTGLWSCFLNWLGLWLWRWVVFVSVSVLSHFYVTVSSPQGMSSPGKVVTMLKTAYSCSWWGASRVSHRHLLLISAGSTEGEQPQCLGPRRCVICMYLFHPSVFKGWWGPVLFCSHKNALEGCSVVRRQSTGDLNGDFGVSAPPVWMYKSMLKEHKRFPQTLGCCRGQWPVAQGCTGAAGSSSPCHLSGRDTTSWTRRMVQLCSNTHVMC